MEIDYNALKYEGGVKEKMLENDAAERKQRREKRKTRRTHVAAKALEIIGFKNTAEGLRSKRLVSSAYSGMKKLPEMPEIEVDQ